MISVIVPYNKDRGFLDQCIESIESQDYPHELILSFGNKPVAVNFNEGLKRATGEFCKFVTEDDYLPQGALRKLAQGIGLNPWIFANAIQVGEDQYIYKPPPNATSFKENLIINRIHGGTTLYRTGILKEIGGMDETLWTGEEYEMHLRLFSLGYYPGYIDESVYCHRLWSGQKSKILRKNNKDERDNEIKRIQALYSDKV